MENLLRIFEEKKAQEERIDEQKLRYLASKVAIWDHFGIQAHYLALDTNEKSQMLNEYYKKLVPVYFGDGKNGSFFFLSEFFLSEIWILACFWVFFEKFIGAFQVSSTSSSRPVL